RHAANLDSLEPGGFYFDRDADRLYLADDPVGHTVELGSTSTAFSGSARDVTIHNLTIEKYANPAQIGAIYGVESKNWTVTDNLVRLNHGVGIVVGDGMQVLSNRALRNGQMGITGIGANVRVEDNEIAYNNFARFEPGWEAGGTKFVATTDLVVRGNYVHDNDGPGLWTDTDNVGALYEGNLVVGNAMMGIFHEISYRAAIRNNVVMLNSPHFDAWAYGAQIQISSSRDVEVWGNRVVVSAVGGSGIVILEQDRGAGALGPRIATNNRVRDNTIIFLGAAGQAGAATDWRTDTFWTERDNQFQGNRYFAADPSVDHWAWDNRTMSWNDFRAQGQEPGGSLSRGVPTDAAAIPAWTLPRSSLPSGDRSGPIALLALGAALVVSAVLGLSLVLLARRPGRRPVNHNAESTFTSKGD
ncbi:MAG: right-handed parallel beta-helix repeat-containing protein, partial [Anaerolineae bacterium]|nr:right-handed parallel beta-helix repeat-containing protein [Anaerolineae bacterium]